MTAITKIDTTAYRLIINVKHWSGARRDEVVLESHRPFTPIHEGEVITIGELEGYPDERQAVAKVDQIRHTLTGGKHLVHQVMIFATQVRD